MIKFYRQLAKLIIKLCLKIRFAKSDRAFISSQGIWGFVGNWGNGDWGYYLFNFFIAIVNFEYLHSTKYELFFQLF